ncbi:MAG: C26 family cysteine hydrolase domain-containing family [Oscillibacter sp.]|nr:C26 family cysteine hydrolase domain-containing family [Oscillibacter sp.]
MEKTVYIWGEAKRFANYRRWVNSAGGRVVFGRDVAGQGEKWDALLLPGGGDLESWRYGQADVACRGLEPERDEAEFRLLQDFTAAGKPVLGVCRGLQTINVFFGGTLVQDLYGHSAWEGTDRLHTVECAPALLPPFPGGTLTVNSAHHQAADRLGSGLQAAQWTKDGVVEALCHRRLPVWAVQWHPERLGDCSLGRRLLGAFWELGR